MRVGGGEGRRRAVAVVMVVLVAAAVVLAASGGPAGADPVVGNSLVVGASLSGVAVDPALHRVYVVDQKTATLFAIDGLTEKVVGSVAVPVASIGSPIDVAADPQTHRVFVTTDSGLQAFDGPKLALIGNLGGGALSGTPAVVPALGRVFALGTDPASGTITVVAYSTSALLNPGIVVGPQSGGAPTLAVDTSTKKVFVNHVVPKGNPGEGIAVLDAATLAQLTSITGQEGGGIGVDPAAGRLYLPDSATGTMPVVDEATGNAVATLTLGPPSRTAYLSRVAVDPVARLAFVTGGQVSGAARADVITVVDTAAEKVLTVLAVNGAVAVDPTRSRGYAATLGGRQVTVLLEDTTPPNTTAGPPTTGAGTMTVPFSATDNVTPAGSFSFACSVDGGPFAPCTSPVTFSVSNGAHTVSVRATDLAGNVDPSAASVTATVSAATPGTTAPTGVRPTTTAPSAVTPGSTTTTVAGAVGAPGGDTTTTQAAASPAEPSQPAGDGGPGTPAPVVGATIVARATGGGASGPPGVGLTVTGAGFAPAVCPTVFIRLADQRLGTAHPDGAGAFRVSGLALPGDARAGAHSVVASCSPAGTPAARSTFAVTGATVHRLAFTTSLHRPDQVPHTARDLGLGALVAAALVLLVAFPSELFDSTLAENYDEVCGWFSFVRPLGRRLAALPRGAVAAGGLVVAAAIYGFADPGFGVGLSSLAELLGLVLALAVMTIAFGAPMAVFVRRRYGDPARLAVLPTGLLIAAGCVVVSRLLHFQPGYLYGAVIGLAFSRELGEREEGLLSSLSMVTMLGVAVLAWFAWAAVEPAAAGRHPSFSVVVLDAMLAAVTVSGIESVVVTMLPVRFMEGRRISRWDRRVWAVVFAAALFAFVEILLRPGAGYVSRAGQGSQVLVIVALLAFGGGSVLFWAYFRFRRPRTATTTTPQFP